MIQSSKWCISISTIIATKLFVYASPFRAVYESAFVDNVMCLSYFETLWLMAFSLAYLNQLVSECHLPATVTFKMIFHGQHKKKSWSHSYRAISSAKFYLRCSCTHNHFCDKRHPKRKHATQINSSIIECVSSPVFFSHCANIMQIK